MDYSEWERFKKSDRKLLDWTYYNKSHQLMKIFNTNNNTNKTEVHHLMNTEEQRSYNKTYYERWGFNEDGTFEYGKYVIFVTRHEHAEIHRISEETRKKISEANKGKKLSAETRKKLSESHKGIPCSESAKEKFREIYKGKRNGPMSAETKNKISNSNRGKKRSSEFKQHLSKINSGKNNPMYGKSGTRLGVKLSDETKHKMSESSKGNKAFLGRSHNSSSKMKISIANSGEGNGMYGAGDKYRALKKLVPSITWHNFLKLCKSNYLMLKTIFAIFIGLVDVSKCCV